MKKHWLLSLCILVGAHAYPTQAAVSDEVVKAIVQNEPNPYYAGKAKEHAWDFAQTFWHENTPVVGAIIGIAGGVGSGVTYLVSEDSHTIHRLEIGPLHGVLTHNTLRFLQNNELILIAPSNSGTGVFAVSGFLIRIEHDKPRLLLVFPINGYVHEGMFLGGQFEDKNGQLGFHYEMVGIERNRKKGCTLNMVVRSEFINVPAEAQPKILERFKLNTLEVPFAIIIDHNRKATLQGSAGVKEFVKDTLRFMGAEHWKIQTFPCK